MNRLEISEENVIRAELENFSHLIGVLKRKGKGSFSSRHEILGILQEEFLELNEAVHLDQSKGFINIKEELLDIAAACIFGIACINQGAIEW